MQNLTAVLFCGLFIMNPFYILGFISVFSALRLVGGKHYSNSFNKLTHVPREIPRNVTRIYLNNNDIANIESDTFAENSQCVKLRLDYNNLSEVRNDMWIGLISLQYLSLEHNDIEHVESSGFADLTNLKGLYLHFNKLKTLPGNVFPPKQMPVLEILTLHDNNLKHDELGWLRKLCDSGQIQQYTVRGDDIKCTRVLRVAQLQQQRIQPKKIAHGSDVAQHEHNTQVEPVSHVEVLKADTTAGDYQTTIVDDVRITWVTGPEPKNTLELPGGSKNEANNREYSHQDLVRWILISAVGAIILTGTAIVLFLRSRALMSARDKKKKRRRIHQRQENRPAAPLPPIWRNTHPPTNLQGLQEYRALVDPPIPTEPSTNTNQSSDTYAVPYQHMLGRFIAFMSMYQRRRHPRPPPPPMPPDLIQSAASTMDRSDGYLVPRLDPHYHELNEASLLSNRPTNV